MADISIDPASDMRNTASFDRHLNSETGAHLRQHSTMAGSMSPFKLTQVASS